MKMEELSEPRSNHPLARRPYEINDQSQKSWRRVKRAVMRLRLVVLAVVVRLAVGV
jgi:hypothetical protein